MHSAAVEYARMTLPCRPCATRVGSRDHTAVAMHEWTPNDIRQALDSRDRVLLETLALDVLEIAGIGRRSLGRRWGVAALRHPIEDDLQDVVEYFFREQGRLLRKYGAVGDHHTRPDGFRRYAWGVSVLFLQQRYSRDKTRHESPVDDMSTFLDDAEPFQRKERDLDMERLLPLLSPADQALYDMIYVQQLDKHDICAQLDVKINTFEQRKSRLSARLGELLATNRREVKGVPHA